MEPQKVQLTFAHQERALESLRADVNLLQNQVKVLALALANVVNKFPEVAKELEQPVRDVLNAPTFGGHPKLFFATQVPPK
jgi:uncharacterized coiled-coil protein SlyX